jgi:hypothetical protein
MTCGDSEETSSHFDERSAASVMVVVGKRDFGSTADRTCTWRLGKCRQRLSPHTVTLLTPGQKLQERLPRSLMEV